MSHPSFDFRFLRPTRRSSIVVVMAGLLGACTSTHPGARDSAEKRSDRTAQASSRNLIVPDFMADPLEPVNRGMWEFNRGLLAGVLEPTGKVYRRVLPEPVRGSITDFTRNITYPGRVVNHALQGRWEGAGDETLRFICNTTAGIGGVFDVASKWDIPKSNANFSQTFGSWGWKPQSYLVLPFLGPSDDRNLVGRVADRASEPWTYVGYPYAIGSHVSTYNELTGITEEALRIVQSESDSYALVKYAWSYGTKDQQPDWTVKGPIDVSTMQTLGAARVSYRDPEFLGRGKELKVRIPSTGRKLKFNYWLHPGAAPLVYISPGLSSHRLSMTTLSIAEHLHRNGFSVVTTTSVFHPEFMENASSSALPVYPPVDCRDLLVAMTEADHALVGKYPGRFGKRALVGLSMGGFLALRMAAHEDEADAGLLRFDRYVAINPPVDLIQGALCVDGFQEAPMAWPADVRQQRLNNTLHKAAAIGVLGKAPTGVPPFDAVESKYLIGLTFRITLRDIIFSSQTRNNMGVLETPLSAWKREEAYREIMSYSYKDYFLKLAVPYYQKQGIDLVELTREGDLRMHESELRRQSKVRLVTNRNDFLLRPHDLSWLRSTFKPSQLTVFADGGHLGNLGEAPVQQAVIKSLGGLN